MQRRHFLRLTLAGVAGLGLSGCGFRLRGLEAGGGPEALHLAAANDDLAQAVRERLAQAGTRLDEAAALRLNLGAERLRERPLGVAESGNREIELILEAPFSVQRVADGAYLLPREILGVSRRLHINEANLLAADDQRREAEAQLRREAASRLLERLRPLAGQE